MRKMNILYVVTQLELGGAQKQLLSLIRRLNRDRYNLFLFTAQDGLLMEEALSIVGLSLHRSKYLKRSVDPLRDLLAMIEMTRFIKKNKIDIVHTHSSKAGILGRWAGILTRVKMIIHTVHGWSFNDFQMPFFRKLCVGLEKLSARFTDKIIVVSHHDKQKGLRFKIGTDSRYSLLRYGIDRAQFGMKDPSVRSELGISDDALVIGTIACFKPQKALEDFVKLAFLAKQVFPRVRFLLIGDGVLREKIEKLIEKFDLSSQFILAGWRKDVPRLLSAMNVFTLTSLWEGLPVAVLEAMVSQVPVVATRTGGISEIVMEGETGFLVPCHDMSSMLEKVCVLFRDVSLKNRIIQSAKQRVNEKFDTETMVKAHEDLYQRLIEAKGMACAN
ncbi:MAG: glycosyltransferase family 4 protein [Candidatus Omnitrophica bacterium]|nr:glycosyltransferase family 4 protein [Candidatus Omnitrophota bacterium]